MCKTNVMIIDIKIIVTSVGNSCWEALEGRESSTRRSEWWWHGSTQMSPWHPALLKSDLGHFQTWLGFLVFYRATYSNFSSSMGYIEVERQMFLNDLSTCPVWGAIPMALIQGICSSAVEPPVPTFQARISPPTHSVLPQMSDRKDFSSFIPSA